MYPGYIAIGSEDIFIPGSQVHEVVNNQRAYAYASKAGLDWLQQCDACPDAAVIVPGGPRFSSPVEDPAPWYRDDNPDSRGFLGVVGIEATGAENSTRQASVTMGLTGGGIIGPTYMAPRTIVVRALAIATDECSLQYGLTWLRAQYAALVSPCEGDPMTFFDCCPCMCEEAVEQFNPNCWVNTYRELRTEPPGCELDYWPATYGQLDDFPPTGEWCTWPESYLRLRIGPPDCGSAGGPCWADNYGELMGEPSCDPEYWPSTYAEIMTGPPADSDEWCAWPDVYYYLRTGPPPWSCCVDECIVPYMRQFRNVRVTSGPTILTHPEMHSCGAMAEIEFTIVAADPVQYTMPYVPPTMPAALWMRGDELVSDVVAEPVPVVDPWAVELVA